jgi:hypothetical protein
VRWRDDGQEGEDVAKAYWINTFRVVRNPKKVADYIEIAGPVMREWEVASWPAASRRGYSRPVSTSAP